MLLLRTLLCLSLDIIYQTLSRRYVSKNAISTVKINVNFNLWGMQLNALGCIFKFYIPTSVHLVPFYENIFPLLPYFDNYIKVNGVVSG